VTSFLCSSSFCCSIWAASSSAVSSVILVSRWAGGDPAGGKREEEEEAAAAAAAKTLEWQADSRSLAQWGVAEAALCAYYKSTDRVARVRAPTCGSGKTTGADMWARPSQIRLLN
jgi:hypothetical protein